MFLKNKITLIIIIPISLAAFIRFYDLDRGNAVSDEVLYGFRSIGYLDFSFALSQPTTLQLFSQLGQSIPGWTKLSFHDHPPLVFLVQHWFIKIFGVNLWGIRLSSAFFGLLSIYLLFLIGRKLFSQKVGLMATGLLAANVLMVSLSRTAMQEAQVIFFILLTVYLFLKAGDNPRWYLASGAVFGLALLSKYTAIFLVIPLLIYLLFYNRSAFRKQHLYGGILIGLIVFSPVVIYNLLLYKTFGHFDFQLSHVLAQEVSYWQEVPGKEIGTMAERAVGIFKNFWWYNSSVFNLLALVGLVFLMVQAWLRKKSPSASSYLLLVLIIITNLFFYLIIGPGIRFLTIIIPWLALSIALAVVWLIESKLKTIKRLGLILLSAVIIWETAYAINSYLLSKPIGKEIVSYSRIHWDMHPWGFNKLDNFLEEVYKKKYPQLTLPYNLRFLEEIRAKAIEKAQAQDYLPANILTIYNDNIFDLASLWIFERRSLYQGWPILPATKYQQIIEQMGESFFRESGFTDFYFIQPSPDMLFNEVERRTTVGDNLEKQLQNQEIIPVIISNYQDKEAFRIYRYQ